MATDFKIYKKKEILEALYGRGRMVFEALGVEYYHKGNYDFVLCPNPDHDDKRATNCYITNTGCNCQACGEKMNFIDITQALSDRNYPETLKFLAELVGSASDFEMSKSESKDYTFNRSFLSFEDLDFLGLAGNAPKNRALTIGSKNNSGLFLINEMFEDKSVVERYVEDYGYEMRRSDEGYYIYKRMPNETMITLAADNPDLYWEIVSNKIEEKKQYLNELEEWVESVTDMHFYEAFRDIIKEEKVKLLTIHDR